MTSVNLEFETFISIPREFTPFNAVLNNGSTSNANGDYSLGSDFKFDVTEDNTNITRMIIYIQDSALSAIKYGNLDALANGVKIYYKKGSETKVYFNAIGRKSNADWAQLCFDLIRSAFGVGDESIVYRLSFSKLANIVLNNGDEFGVEISDNLTGLTTHCFNVQGYY